MGWAPARSRARASRTPSKARANRRRRHAADVVQAIDVVVADRELVVLRQVEVGADEVLVAVGRSREFGAGVVARVVVVERFHIAVGRDGT